METKFTNNFFESLKHMNFYDQTSKRNMYLMIKSLCENLKNENQTWLNKAEDEKYILISNGIIK